MCGNLPTRVCGVRVVAAASGRLRQKLPLDDPISGKSPVVVAVVLTVKWVFVYNFLL